jgi:putative transposase
MQLTANHLYHIYNQGNNREKLFYSEENYYYFLRKVREHIKPYGHIMAWCLMPNHFHFLIGTSTKSIEKIQFGNIEISRLSNAFRLIESGYAKAINKQEGRSGSLFRQKTKAKCLTKEAFNFEDITQKLAPDFFNLYPIICFNYIHQNPVKAKLVTKMEDWPFSSFQDYLQIRQGTLCDYDLCKRWVGVREIDLNPDNLGSFKEEDLAKIF